MQSATFWLTGFLSFFVMIEPAPVDVLLIGALVLAAMSFQLRWRRDFAYPFVVLGVFVACNLIPFFYPGVRDYDRGIFYLLISGYLIAAYVFVAAMSGTRSEQIFHTFILGCAMGAALSTALAFLGMIGVLPTIGDMAKVPGRLQGFFKDPNVYGPSLVPVLLYTLTLISRQRRARHNVMLLSLVVLCALGILLSFSRAAWLNFAVSALAFAFLRWRQAAAPLLRLAVVCGLLVLGAAWVVIGMWEELSTLFLARLELQSYDEDRFAVQEAALARFLGEPLGVGPGQAEVLFQYAAHSLYARLLLENGALGTLALVSVLLYGTWRMAVAALRNPSSAIACVVAATLVGLLANSFFIDTVHWRHLWIYLGFAYGVQTYAHNVHHHESGTRRRAVSPA